MSGQGNIANAWRWRAAVFTAAAFTAAVALTPISAMAQQGTSTTTQAVGATQVISATPAAGTTQASPTAGTTQISPATQPAGLLFPDYGMSPDIPRTITIVDEPPRTIDLLGAALPSATPENKLVLLDNLGQCQSARGLPFLKPYFSNADPLLRAAAARAAGMIGDSSAIPELSTLMSDADATVRVAAVEAGGALRAEPVINVGLADADPTVIAAAMRVAFTPAQGALIAGKLPALSPDLAPTAIAAIARIGATEYSARIAAAMTASDACKAAGLQALETLKASDQLSAIEADLNDSQPAIRAAAVAALTTTANQEVKATQAAKMVEDPGQPDGPDPAVQLQAVRLLTSAPNPIARDDLVPLLASDYPGMHDAALAALAAMGSDAEPAATALMQSPSAPRRVDGATLAGLIKQTSAEDRLIALLNDPNATVEVAAATSLGQVGLTQADEPINAFYRRASESGASDFPLFQPGQIAAFITAAQLHDEGLLDAARDWALRAPTPPPAPDFPMIRAAAAYAVGLLAPRNDPICGQLAAKIHNPTESEITQGEDFKAMVNLGDSKTLANLPEWENNQTLPLIVRWYAWRTMTLLGQPAAPPPAPRVKAGLELLVSDFQNAP